MVQINNYKSQMTAHIILLENLVVEAILYIPQKNFIFIFIHNIIITIHTKKFLDVGTTHEHLFYNVTQDSLADPNCRGRCPIYVYLGFNCCDSNKIK